MTLGNNRIYQLKTTQAKCSMQEGSPANTGGIYDGSTNMYQLIWDVIIISDFPHFIEVNALTLF